MDEKHENMTETPLQEKVPPLDDLIFGNHTTEELMAEISKRGNAISSAKQCCEYFCTPPGIKKTLMKAIEGSSIKWGQYSHNSREALSTLENERRIIIPKEKRELPTTDSVRPCQATIIDTKLLPRDNPMTKESMLPIENTKHLDEAIAEKISTVTVNHMLGGFKFQGTIDNVWRTFSMVDIVRGIIYNAALHTAIWVQPPTSTLEYGLTALVTQVPRFHEARNPREPTEYSVSFNRIPAYKETKKVPGNGFDVTLASSAPRSPYELKPFRNRPKGQKPEIVSEMRWDHYIILAYERTAQKLEKEGVHVIRPYPQITADQIRFYWKMLHKCLIREENGKIKSMIQKAEEFIFWKYIATTKTA
ncbi:MAG: hypothetical protein NTW67_06215 [Candidatus Woesearchaeota archaeon]|nr:hypothetical protein [Candidatus Woesearchaeota archaeon]